MNRGRDGIGAGIESGRTGDGRTGSARTGSARTGSARTGSGGIGGLVGRTVAAGLALGGAAGLLACESAHTGSAGNAASGQPGGPTTATGAATSPSASATASTASTVSTAPTSAGGSGGSGGSGTTGTTAVARACHADQLTVSLARLPGAAAGTVFSDVVVTNTSAAECTVSGSVGVAVLDTGHQPVPVPVTVDASSGTLSLKPGGAEAQTLAYSSDGNPAPGHTACAPTEAYYAVTPPGTAIAQIVAVPHRGACPADRISLSAPVAGAYSPPG